MQHFSVSSEHCARSDFNKILGLSRNEPGAIGWDARMLPLCYATTLHLKKHSLGKNLFEAFKSKFWKNAVGLKFQLQLNDVVKIDSWLKFFWSFFDFFFLLATKKTDHLKKNVTCHSFDDSQTNIFSGCDQKIGDDGVSRNCGSWRYRDSRIEPLWG